MKKRKNVNFIYHENFRNEKNLSPKELIIEFNKKYYLLVKENYDENRSIS